MTKLADIFKHLSDQKPAPTGGPSLSKQTLASLRIGYQAGLVINGNAIQLSLIKFLCHRRKLVKTAQFDLPADSLINRDTKLTSICLLVDQFLEGFGKGNIPINIALSGDDIAQRRVYLPQMPAKELHQAALWEGEKLFPFKFEDCYVGQETVDLFTRNGSPQISINLTAVNRSIIDLIYSKFSIRKLKVGQIGFVPDITARFPLEEMFKLPNDYYLVLYIDPDNSYAAFVKNRQLEFFQQFISQPRANDGGDISNLDMLSTELISFLDMFSGMGHRMAPEAIILAGRYAQHPEVKLHFAKGITTYNFLDADLFPGISGNYDAQIFSQFLPVIQTALLDSHHQPLAPPAIRKKDQDKTLAYRLSMAVVIGLLITSGIHTAEYLHIRKDRAKLLSLQEQTSAFETSPAYQEYLNLLAKLNRGKDFLKNNEDRNQSHFHYVLKELSLTIPKELCLTSVALDSDSTGYHLQLSGNVKLRDFSPEIVLARYIELLDQSPIFRNVKVVHHRKSKTSDQFDLSFQLRMDAGV